MVLLLFKLNMANYWLCDIRESPEHNIGVPKFTVLKGHYIITFRNGKFPITNIIFHNIFKTLTLGFRRY